jgi:uncharacterized protein YheU (UPF0270 family)
MSGDEFEQRAPDDEPEPPVEVPHTEVEPATLRRLVESFVLREGTDYGAVEYSLEQKVAHVLAQLERGDARMLFDPNTESVTIAAGRGVRPR